MAAATQKNLLERLVFLFGCALIVFFFSEFFFFNEGPVDELRRQLETPLALLLHLLEFGGWYLLVVAPALILMSFARADNMWAIFLVGVFAGYCIEGLLVSALYIELPISLFWTSMSWHPLVDILFGLWLWQKWLRTRSVLFNFAVAVAMGAGWAVWSTWPVGNSAEITGEVMEFTPFADYLGFVFVSTGVLFVGNLLANWGASRLFAPVRLDIVLFGAASFALFVFMAIQVSYLIVLLPLILGLIGAILLLRKNMVSEASAFSIFETNMPIVNQLTVWAMPCAAALTYWVLGQLNWHIESWIVAMPMVIIGIAFGIVAIIKSPFLRRV